VTMALCVSGSTFSNLCHHSQMLVRPCRACPGERVLLHKPVMWRDKDTMAGYSCSKCKKSGIEGVTAHASVKLTGQFLEVLGPRMVTWSPVAETLYPKETQRPLV
jgi:hypothetical protein